MFYSEREVLRPILTDGSMGVVPGLNRMEKSNLEFTAFTVYRLACVMLNNRYCGENTNLAFGCKLDLA